MASADKDHILALGLLEGRLEALEELYVTYAPQVRAFVLHYTGNVSDAEDITHDVFMKIWNKRGTLRAHESLSSLMFTMARNAVLDAIRHKKIRNRYVEQFVSNIDPPPLLDIEPSIHAREELEILERKFDELPDRQKQIFMMSRREGMTYAEISRELHISEKTVQYHISQALKDLRNS